MRERLIEFLARAVVDGLMSEEAAADMVERFDRGELVLTEADLPLGLGQGIQPMTDETGAAASALLASLGGGEEGQHEALHDWFDQRVGELAEQVRAGAISVAAWQVAMVEAIQVHLLAQALAGGVGYLSDAEVAEIQAEAQLQAAFLSRFADELLLSRLWGDEMSAAEIANRAVGYAGVGWAWYYRARETGPDIRQEGIVIDYEAVDDKRTCSPCLGAEAAGPYLPGSGPFPGEVCLGRGRCRCKRKERYDLEAWRRLTGR